jgi:hypothetical protein
MIKAEIFQILNRIIADYEALNDPKYKHADIDVLKREYDLLMEMKEFLTDDRQHANIVNAISQTINKMTHREEKDWRCVTERGINKTIPPIVRKKNKPVQYSFEWVDGNTRESCFINTEHWGARNYMVMDIVGYYLLLKEGKNRLPKDPAPIFGDMNAVAARESNNNSNNIQLSNEVPMNDQDIIRIEKTRYWVQFDDKEFRRSTSLDMSSNEIRDLLLETSRAECKLVFPVRICEGKKPKYKTYNMNFFSRLFEFGFVDKEPRSDGLVQNRHYRISFNTTLGELFAHNLLSKSYDWLDNRFYSLPYNAQIFYRKFLVHNDVKKIPFNIETIAERLNLQDKNITNLTGTIETNVLKPLMEQGLIDSYEKTKGLNGLKYIIWHTRKRKPQDKNDLSK